MFRLPKRSLTFWLIGVGLGLAVLPLLIYSGNLYYAEGGDSPDAPGMVFVSAAMTMPIWWSAWLALIAPFLWRYRAGGRLSDLRGGSLVAHLLTALSIAISFFFLWSIFARVEFWRVSRLPFTAHLLACAVYFQYLRAAAVRRSLPDSGESELTKFFR